MNRLRKHPSNDVRRLVKHLVRFVELYLNRFGNVCGLVCLDAKKPQEREGKGKKIWKLREHFISFSEMENWEKKN